MPKKRLIVAPAPAERERLETMVSKGKGAAYRIKHANILLASDENGPTMKDDAIATALRCHSNTIANVWQRFVALLHNSDRGRVFVWSRFASSDHLTARQPQCRHRV